MIRKGHSFILAILAGMASLPAAHAQTLLFPTDYLFDLKRQEMALNDTDVIVHTAQQPFLYKAVAPDTLKKVRYDADPFFDKVFYENFIQVRHTDRSSGYNRTFNLDINPLVNFYFGKDFEDTLSDKVQYNTRGFWMRAQIGRHLLLESAFVENQAFAPNYIYTFGQATSVVPGQGRWKKFKNRGYDYASSYGVVNVSITKGIVLRLGHGKQKVGHGYRSLLLSDNAFNYPYVQVLLASRGGRLQYSQTYALLMNLGTGGAKTPPNTEPIFQKKPATFQHLGWQAAKSLNLYFFQGTVWKAADSSNSTRVDGYYFNPLIYSNLLKFGFNHTNHIVAGGGLQLRPFRSFAIYAQGMYDGEFTDPVTAAKEVNWGWQAGIRYFSAFGVRNLFLQYEADFVKGKSYYSARSPYQHYSHYGQLLTTPALLENEMITLAAYTIKKAFIQLKYNVAFSNSSAAIINYFDARAGYLFNQHYNLAASVGANLRSFLPGAGAPARETQLFYISLSTSLYNIYHDF
jgi:hypothetical protein